MADEQQVTRVPVRPVEVPPRPRRTPTFPDDPDAARAEIEATRARMSETLDEIEGALLRKKEEVREKMDVLAPVREQPVKTIAMIFGAALVLGFLSAGGKQRKTPQNHHDEEDLEADSDREAEEERLHEEAELAWSRAEAWEDRAHRLLRIAQAQESELEVHRSRRDSFLQELRDLRHRARKVEEEEDDDYEDGDEDDLDGEANVLQRLRDSATERLAGLANQVSYRMMRGS